MRGVSLRLYIYLETCGMFKFLLVSPWASNVGFFSLECFQASKVILQLVNLELLLHLFFDLSWTETSGKSSRITLHFVVSPRISVINSQSAVLQTLHPESRFKARSKFYRFKTGESIPICPTNSGPFFT